MNAKPPPIPQENRSDKGTGASANPREGGDAIHADAPDPDHRGQGGDIRQNTTHQGHQQDR